MKQIQLNKKFIVFLGFDQKQLCFFVYIGNTSKADYDSYVDECVACGFDVDYDKGDTYYRADNADGYHVSLAYEGNDIMTIEITPKTNYEYSIEEPVKDESSESEPASDETSAGESAAEESSAAENTTTPEETKVIADPNEIRSDFKEAMDSYEAFIDEYVAFMKKYEDNPTDMELIGAYADYMSKYAEAAEKFDNWESEGLTDAELSYYLDVQTRVSKKLLEVEE